MKSKTSYDHRWRRMTSSHNYCTNIVRWPSTSHDVVWRRTWRRTTSHDYLTISHTNENRSKWPKTAKTSWDWSPMTSLSIAFLAISDQYAIYLIFFSKWPPAAILDSYFYPNRSGPPSIVCQWLHQIWSWSVHFWLSYRVHKLFSSYFHKMAAGGHFGFSDLLQNR